MAAGGGVCKVRPRIRCIDAVRYVVAALVTVLIVAVAVYAVVVVLRPDKLIVKVGDGGLVSAELAPAADNATYTFSFSLQAFNPSARVITYYTNITAYITDVSSPSSPVRFVQPDMGSNDMEVDQQMATTFYIQVRSYSLLLDLSQMPALEKLRKNGSITEAMIQLRGTATTELYSGHNGTVETADYYCWYLTVAPANYSGDLPGDVQCTDNPPPGVDTAAIWSN